MRYLISALMLLAGITQAAAMGQCDAMSDKYLKVLISRGTGQGLEIEVQNLTEKTAVIIHASILVTDALGVEVGNYKLPAYQTAKPGDLIHAVLPTGDFSKVNMKYFSMRVCVYAMLFDDGSKVGG